MRQQSCTSRGTTALLSTRLTRLFFGVWGGFLLMGLLLAAMTMTQRAQAAAPFKPVGMNAEATGETRDPMSKISVPQEGADLEVVKSVSDATPNEGQIISYTITVTNFGPEDATTVRIADTLPVGVTFSRYTATRGTYTDNVWRVNRINSGESVTLTIAVTVNQNTTGQIITNTASISRCDQTDPNSDNNTDEAVMTVTGPAADLAVSKSVNQANPEENELITYTITVTNLGPDDATGVQIADTLPVSLTYIPPYTASQGSYDSNSGQWTLENPLAPGASATLIIMAQVITGTAGQTIPNTASISASDQDDPDQANNTAKAVLSVTGPTADLAVHKRVNQANPAEGEVITYTITLTNLGPDEANNVEISDPLPISVTFARYTATRGIYTNNRWIINDPIAPGTSLTLTIAATVEIGTASQTITNVASVLTADPPDLNPANNTGTATMTVTEADLAVIKTVDNSMPNAGDTITYMITVTNNGPDDASGVQISDIWPTGVIYLPPAIASRGSYDHDSGLWTVGDLAHTASATLTIAARVDTCTNGRTITNTAILSTPISSDPNPNNNTDDASMTVTRVITCYVYLPIIFENYPPPPCYTETFTSDDPVIGWPPPPTSPLVLVEYLNGEYHMLTKDTTQVHSVTSPLGPYTNYSVQVDVRWAVTTSYVDDDYGIVFDLTISNNNQYYQFNVNNDNNTYRLRKRENNQWINLIPPTPAPSSCILGGTSVNKLKIQRNSSSIDLFINGCQLPSYTNNSQLTLTRPAFMGVNIFPSDFVNGEAYFDNFTICTYEQNQVNIHGLQAKPTLNATHK